MELLSALPPNSTIFPFSRSPTHHLSLPSCTSHCKYSSHLHLRRSILGFNAPAEFLCCSTGPGSPLPESDPPPGKHPVPTTDLEATLYTVQDKVQIFFAVLFWMSLFFWTCAWDGRDDGGSNKGSQFRR